MEGASTGGDIVGHVSENMGGDESRDSLPSRINIGPYTTNILTSMVCSNSHTPVIEIFQMCRLLLQKVHYMQFIIYGPPRV